MSDVRSALPKKIGWRLAGTADPLVETDAIGGNTNVDDGSPTEEWQTGYNRPVGAGYNLNLEIKDPDLWLQVKTDMMALSSYDFVLTYSSARTITVSNVGFQANPLRTGSIGVYEGFVMTGFGYGEDSDDVLAISPAIAP